MPEMFILHLIVTSSYNFSLATLSMASPILLPGQKIEDIIMDVPGQSSELMQTPVEITATYKDSGNKECKNTFPLNFGLYEGVRQMGDPLSGIHDSLQSIKQSLCSISQQIQND